MTNYDKIIEEYAECNISWDNLCKKDKLDLIASYLTSIYEDEPIEISVCLTSNSIKSILSNNQNNEELNENLSSYLLDLWSNEIEDELYTRICYHKDPNQYAREERAKYQADLQDRILDNKINTAHLFGIA